MNEDQKWKYAEECLQEVEQAYAEVGSVGLFGMAAVIAPLRDRLNKGERTDELYDEIMDISL